MFVGGTTRGLGARASGNPGGGAVSAARRLGGPSYAGARLEWAGQSSGGRARRRPLSGQLNKAQTTRATAKVIGARRLPGCTLIGCRRLAASGRPAPRGQILNKLILLRVSLGTSKRKRDRRGQHASQEPRGWRRWWAVTQCPRRLRHGPDCAPPTRAANLRAT